MQDYSVAHVIADLDARYHLCVCSMQDKPCCCVGGGRTMGAPLHRAVVMECAQELRCPDLGPAESCLCDEQVTTLIPSPQ